MAYNITRFHVKAIDNLCIPILTPIIIGAHAYLFGGDLLPALILTVTMVPVFVVCAKVDRLLGGREAFREKE